MLATVLVSIETATVCTMLGCLSPHALGFNPCSPATPPGSGRRGSRADRRHENRTRRLAKQRQGFFARDADQGAKAAESAASGSERSDITS